MSLPKAIFLILGNHLPEAVQNEGMNQVVLVNQRAVSNSRKQPIASNLEYFSSFFSRLKSIISSIKD